MAWLEKQIRLLNLTQNIKPVTDLTHLAWMLCVAAMLVELGSVGGAVGVEVQLKVPVTVKLQPVVARGKGRVRAGEGG